MKTTWTGLALIAAIVSISSAATAGEDIVSPSIRVVVNDDGSQEIGRKGGYLGLRLREETKNPEGGARIEEVLPDSPAEKAGLKEGDIIVGFGDAIIRGPVGLTERLRKASAGDQARVTVLRDGKRETVTVKLGERTAISVFKMTPGEEGEIELAVPDTKTLERNLEDVQKSIPELRDKERKLRLLLGAPGGSHVLRFLAEKPRLGVELLDVTADLREYFGGKKETGVLVGKVLTGSPAERAGLRAGDLIVAVDGEAVESSGDLIGIVAEKKAGSLDIDVIRDKKPLKLKATLPARDEDEEAGEPVGPRAALLPPS